MAFEYLTNKAISKTPVPDGVILASAREFKRGNNMLLSLTIAPDLLRRLGGRESRLVTIARGVGTDLGKIKIQFPAQNYVARNEGFKLRVNQMGCGAVLVRVQDILTLKTGLKDAKCGVECVPAEAGNAGFLLVRLPAGAWTAVDTEK